MMGRFYRTEVGRDQGTGRKDIIIKRWMPCASRLEKRLSEVDGERDLSTWVKSGQGDCARPSGSMKSVTSKIGSFAVLEAMRDGMFEIECLICKLSCVLINLQLMGRECRNRPDRGLPHRAGEHFIVPKEWPWQVIFWCDLRSHCLFSSISTIL